MKDLFQDLRLGLRRLSKSPRWTSTVLLTLSPGLALNVAVFSVVYGLLIKPLPYPQPDRVVQIISNNPGADLPRFSVSPPDYRDWKEGSHSFEQMAAFRGRDVTMTGLGVEPERLSGAAVTPGFFRLFGSRAARGRLLGDVDTRQGEEHQVVVLGYGTWVRWLRKDP
jgi:putative ABC transport system permease protein